MFKESEEDSSGRRWGTVIDLLRERAAEGADRLAYTFLVDGEEGERLTFGELEVRARAVGSALQESGAGGERVVLLLPPGLDFVVAFLGCLYGGAVAVPALPPRRRGADPRLRALLADARPRALLTSASLRPVLDALRQEMPELREIRRLEVHEIGIDQAGSWREPRLDSSALAFLQYTSGSTASPKGVKVTHGNLLANEELIRIAFGQTANDVVVGWLPLYHDMGLIGNVLQPLYVGAQCHLMSPLAFLQRPARWLEAVSRLRATTSGGPNFAYELCLRKVTARDREGLDLSSWRVAFNGAEPVRAETLRRFTVEFEPCGFRASSFHPCYGLAEATLLVSCAAGGPRVRALSASALEEGRAEEAAAGEPRRRELVSCGEALQTVVVTDPRTGAVCPEETVGEIWVAGPSVPDGYWERPEETAETFGARLADGAGPFLRTGDLGFLSGGELFLTGRIKDLVILRGRNHYPQDLELTAERSHPDLRPGGGAAVAVEEEMEEGGERLVLVHELGRHARAAMEKVEEIAAAVRRAVAEEHGVAVAEVVLLRPETLPRTTSGKVRRRACRDAWRAGELAEIGRSSLGVAATEEDGGWAALDRGALAGLGPAARRQAVESFLRERAAGVLGLSVSRLPAEGPLTALGLDSLSAVELKAGVEAALGVDVPLADLLGGFGLADLAARLADSLADPGEGGEPLPPLKAAGDEPAEFPLTAGQKALWFLHRLAPASAAYNLAGAARLPASADPAVLRRALQALVDRHDVLRATFAPGSSGPTQRIHPHLEVAFAREDCSGWSDEAVLRRLHEEAFRPFDLERGPLLRAALLTRPDGGFFVLAVHHIVADFWSLAVLARELGTLYGHDAAGGEGDSGLPALDLRFADWARWQERALASPWGERLWDFWRGRLAGVPPLDLPTDRPRPPAQTFRGGARSARYGEGAARGLQALTRERGGTPFTVLATAFAALLSRWSGQEDFVIGSPTAGRMQDRQGGRLAGLVGYFVNPVPLRADLSGDPTTDELLGRFRATALEAFAHQDFPFPLLAERLHPQRDAGRPPLVQVMLTLQKAPSADLRGLSAFAVNQPGVQLDLGGLRLETLALEIPAVPLDLTLMATELEGDLLVALQLNTDLFDAATAERLLGHLGNLLDGMAADPGRRVSDLPLLSAAERAQLSTWNATEASWDLDRPLHAWIEEAAARAPETVAIEAEGESLTYGELLDRSGRLAHHLRTLGIAPDELVGVAAERSPEMVVALLGVLRAGAAYVPLDPEYPGERLAFMLEDSGVRVLLNQVHLSATLPTGAATVVPLDRGAAWEAAPPREPLEPGAGPDGAAYMIYTSGSTGRPKGAVNTHRGIVNRLLWMQETFGLTPEDRVLQKTPTSFDVSVWELFWPLMAGARLVLARSGGHQDPAYLARRIQEAGVTTLHFVPSMLQTFLEEPGAAACLSLRRVIASGEALPGGLARRFQERLGGSGAELYNLYGPTEAAVDVTWWPTRWPASGESGERSVPIGRPVANTRIHLRDAHGHEVPVGGVGELCIGGVQLARGYWRRPELTAERFVPDSCGGPPGERLYRTGDLARRLPGGEIEFLGRLDHQVKLRGVRIELGEIETALAACPEVREAVVGARGQGTALRLVAWVTPAPGREISVAALREALRRKLPEVMVPSAFAVLTSFPLSPNGKVDRSALPNPEDARGGRETPYVAPRTPVEETLAALWGELLKVERVGVDDHFFDLGGHSLLATQLIARVREIFDVDVPLAALFEEAPTVANLARAVSRYQLTAVDEDDLVSALLDLEGLSDEQIRALLESEEV